MAGVAALSIVGGCAMSSVDSKRLVRYHPDVRDRPSNVTGTSLDASSGNTSSDGTPVGFRESGSRILRRGDKINVSLRDIPRSEDLREVVDERGTVSLPLISQVKVEGLSTPEAEELIEKKYIEGEFYKKITVILVAEEDEYFIRDEVKKEGKYPLSRDLTLMQAITSAGGYTDFADPTGVKIVRGRDVLKFNLKKIEKRETEDPLIKPGDTIIVPRGWY